MGKRSRVIAALAGRVGTGHVKRTCLFYKAHNAKGAAITGVLTGTMGYRRPMGNDPYGRYTVYGTVRTKATVGIVRVSTTSGGNISGVHRVHRRITCHPARNGCGICVVSRIRVLSANTFGTLLGALRRPPSCIVFVLTAARTRGVPVAVLSEYRHCSFRQVSVSAVTTELSRLLATRKIRTRRGTMHCITGGNSKSVQSTLDLLSRYVSFCLKRILACSGILSILKTISARMFDELLQGILSNSIANSVRILRSLVANNQRLKRFMSSFA